MEGETRFENYPVRMVILANIFSLATPVLGALVMIGLGWPFAAIYLAFYVFFELRVLTTSCRGCYYFGKTCFSGKGRLAAMFLERSPPESFAARKITWRSIAPDFMVAAIPMAAGIILLAGGFDWLIVVAVILLLLLATVGNGLVRGSIACKHCKQRALGCPAAKLFEGRALDGQGLP